MSKRKTVKELELEAQRAEARAKALRAKARKQTQAEEAKLHSEIVKAVLHWNSTRQNPFDEAELPVQFNQWAQKNIEKYAHE